MGLVKYNIKKLLKENGISCTYMARKLGISRQLFQYYANKGDFPVSYADKMAKELGLPINKMLKSCEYSDYNRFSI